MAMSAKHACCLSLFALDALKGCGHRQFFDCHAGSCHSMNITPVSTFLGNTQSWYRHCVDTPNVHSCPKLAEPTQTLTVVGDQVAMTISLISTILSLLCVIALCVLSWTMQKGVRP